MYLAKLLIDTMSEYKNVLISGVGTAPAVLTNTVWALAHEPEPIVPDEVVAITTLTGRKCIEHQLIDSGGWERLVLALGSVGLDVTDRLAFGASDSIRVIGDGKHDFDDLATPEQNAVAADFILKVLRQYTEDPGTRVIASIAGGRKSMSALVISCMSLLGRSQDRVCHVLVNEPYEQRMAPPFLFPEKGVKHRLGEKNYPSLKAKPKLSDLPFVRVRGWYEREFHKTPPSYMQLVNKVQGIAPKPANYPEVRIDASKGSLKIGDTFISLSTSEFTLLYLMLHRIKQERFPTSWYDLESDFSALLEQTVPTSVDWFHTFKDSGVLDPEDFRKWASSARLKLRRAFGDPSLADMLLPSMKNKWSEAYPGNRITIKDVS